MGILLYCAPPRSALWDPVIFICRNIICPSASLVFDLFTKHSCRGGSCNEMPYNWVNKGIMSHWIDEKYAVCPGKCVPYYHFTLFRGPFSRVDSKFQHSRKSIFCLKWKKRSINGIFKFIYYHIGATVELHSIRIPRGVSELHRFRL